MPRFRYRHPEHAPEWREIYWPHDGQGVAEEIKQEIVHGSWINDDYDGDNDDLIEIEKLH